MAWWGYGPMDGHTPDDIRIGIAEAVHGPETVIQDEDTQWMRRRAISTLEELQCAILAMNQIIAGASDAPFFWHVLAVMVMRGGGPLLIIKEEVLLAIDRDAWACADDDREQAMQMFRAAVQAYTDGCPIDFPEHMALAAVMEQARSDAAGLFDKS